MSDRSAKNLTLRELFTAAERQSRELVTHLDLNFIPKVDTLAKLVRPPKNPEDLSRIADVTVRNQAAQVIDSEKYTAQLYGQLEDYVRAIDSAVNAIIEADSDG